MLLALSAIIVGFVILVWGADRFVEGAAATAQHLGMPPLLIGIVIVGFGTSAPEMVVSAMAALDGNPGLALGNALGSNIVNTGLVLGLTALLTPLLVHSNIVRKELPLLLGLGLIVGWFTWDNSLQRWEASILLGGFFVLIGWSVYSAWQGKDDPLVTELTDAGNSYTLGKGPAFFWLVAGFVLLLISSRILVWGAVSIAQQLGVSDLVIGLTVVALGTSLPELAACVMAARKGEFDIAIGNVVGSNMFNLLAVIGIAGVIHPIPAIDPEFFTRDWIAMMALILAMLFMAFGWKGHQGRINRWEGSALLLGFVAYNAYLLHSVMAG